MQKNITQRLNRESCIPDEDIEQTVKQIIAHPFLGGHKGSLKLQCDETAYIGSSSYQEIKQQLKLAVAKQLLQRNEQSELAKAQYQRYRDKEQPYQKIAAKKKHDVWSIDFLNLLLFGIYFRICVVYDLFSQAYLAIQPACYASYEVAQQALQQACDYSGQTPEKCLLSDRGKQFNCYSFEETKQQLNIKSQFIPRGQPWHNGALESGNRDLRTVLYTIAFYEACNDTRISKIGVASEQILAHLQHYCHQALRVINEQLVRPKFKTTPLAVLQDQVAAKQQQRLRFIEQKRHQRKQRMEQLKRNGGSTKKRIEDKVAAAWRKISSNMTTDQLFAFSELINKRYKAVSI